MNELQQAIANTVRYADIFAYPLTREEIFQRLIGVHASQPEVGKALLHHPSLQKQDEWYVLKGRSELVSVRQRRVTASQKKWRIAQRVVTILSHIPTILLIGVSGGVASNNADEEEDIDLFIIAKTGTLWMTRITITMVLEILRVRRRPLTTDIRNTICVNMLVDDSHLQLPKEEQDLFGAHEVLLLRPLHEQFHTYQQFIHANAWVASYLPQWFAETKKEVPIPHIQPASRWVQVVERWSRQLQRWYMRRHRTTEIIDSGRIRFHPRDVRSRVLRAYKPE